MLWPKLDHLIDEGIFSPLEKAFALRLLGPQGEEEGAVVLARLLKSARRGHLCLTLSRGEEKKVAPALEGKSAPLHLEGDRLYLRRFWECEREVISHFHRLLNATPTYPIEEKEITAKVDKLVSDKILLPEQGRAVVTAATGCLTLLSGGPGTGKTYTAGHLLSLLSEVAPQKIALAAPTGKAAANLQYALGNRISDVKTLHALLGPRRDHPIPLAADLILIDEASMVDVAMMARLLKGVRTGARLILMGDRHQLPPVEAGSLFADFIALKESKPRVAQLTHCLRAERQELIALAHSVNRGDPSLLPRYQRAFKGNDLISYAAGHFPSPTATPSLETLEQFSQFRLLSPVRKGASGVTALNEKLYSHFRQQVRRGRSMVVPIMIAKNDYRLGLANGEMGLLVSHPHQPAEDYALFPTSEGARTLPRSFLPPHDYAYCLSIHKSQGSEYRHVVIVWPDDLEEKSREGLYTAITRAKEKLEIVGSLEALSGAVSSPTSRLSGLGLEHK